MDNFSDCVTSGLHLLSCDDDGYCNNCGEQDSMSSLVELWMDKRGFHNFEGESGVERLKEFCCAIGHEGLEEFLADNPGAIEAILDWVQERGFWVDALKKDIQNYEN